MAEFRGGILRVLKDCPVPVVPMALSGLWQSVFARNRQARRLFPRIRLSVGDALPAAAVTPEKLHAEVLALRGDWR
jgi:1-acyl-sn-glycerol-3-phosphate acyltransferase